MRKATVSFSNTRSQILEDRDSVTTTSITAEGAQLHDLVDLGSSLWLVGSVGETGVLWTLAEGQDDSELTAS